MTEREAMDLHEVAQAWSQVRGALKPRDRRTCARLLAKAVREGDAEEVASVLRLARASVPDDGVRRVPLGHFG
ncbi:MAG: hypothetical protein JWO74_3142 [Solirubrobacterales bacterium]|nr:hypothetical protein [Solirubrobacterales bacterium]